MTEVTLGSDTVAALEAAWADIAKRHPELNERPMVVRIGSGRAGRRGSLVLGSVTVNPDWQANRKTSSKAKSDPDRYHELFLAGETLAQHPVKLMETLIHEAAHIVAMVRGVKDTSRQGRYHNKRFRAICEEMGLAWNHLDYAVTKNEDGQDVFTDHPDYDPAEPVDIRKNPRYITCEAKAHEVIGFSDMEITKATARAYADTVKLLDEDVQVELAAAPIVPKAPKKRRTVCMVRVPNGPGLLPSVADAREYLGQDAYRSEETGYWDEEAGVPETVEVLDLDAQRIGVVVYEGLVERKLLAPHIAWVEEV